MSMILLEPAYKILHTTGEVQAADHLSNTVFQAHHEEIRFSSKFGGGVAHLAAIHSG
jgi:hypothetical protein